MGFLCSQVSFYYPTWLLLFIYLQKFRKTIDCSCPRAKLHTDVRCFPKLPIWDLDSVTTLLLSHKRNRNATVLPKKQHSVKLAQSGSKAICCTGFWAAKLSMDKQSYLHPQFQGLQIYSLHHQCQGSSWSHRYDVWGAWSSGMEALATGRHEVASWQLLRRVHLLQDIISTTCPLQGARPHLHGNIEPNEIKLAVRVLQYPSFCLNRKRSGKNCIVLYSNIGIYKKWSVWKWTMSV